jgi:hypothetical protein
MTGIAETMRAAAADLLVRAPEAARAPFDDDAVRRWIEYRPNPRPGASLQSLDPGTRKAAFRLLATALRPHAFAQAVTIIGLEEVLDRVEGYRRGRHSEDYWVIVFGDPRRDARWGWRFEGHHLSVTMTLDGDLVFPTPVFFGANPNNIAYQGQPVVRPLGPEEDLGFALLGALDPDTRAAAVVDPAAPPDIHSGPRPKAPAQIEPLGVAYPMLPRTAQQAMERLVAVYVDRLVEDLVVPVNLDTLHFAWQGAADPDKGGHYYRIQGPDLLIEYDNTDNEANHAHTVLRRPASDFGGDVLAAHRAARH